jgi:hypothetical protein
MFRSFAGARSDGDTVLSCRLGRLEWYRHGTEIMGPGGIPGAGAGDPISAATTIYTNSGKRGIVQEKGVQN